jgi:hypothetical protein
MGMDTDRKGKLTTVQKVLIGATALFVTLAFAQEFNIGEFISVLIRPGSASAYTPDTGADDYFLDCPNGNDCGMTLSGDDQTIAFHDGTNALAGIIRYMRTTPGLYIYAGYGSANAEIDIDLGTDGGTQDMILMTKSQITLGQAATFSGGFTSELGGTYTGGNVTLTPSDYNDTPLVIGSLRIWDDAQTEAAPRYKDGVPSSATDGTPWHIPRYAHMYQIDSGTTVTIAAANTWVQVDGFSCGVETNLDCDVTSDDITVDKAGDYEVNWSISFSRAAGATIDAEGGIGVNGTVDTSTTSHRTITSNSVGSFGAVTVLALAASDTVELMMVNETDTNNFTIDHAHVTVTWLGE